MNLNETILSDKNVREHLKTYMEQKGFIYPFLVYRKIHPCYEFYDIDTATGFSNHYGSNQAYAEQQKIKTFLKRNGFISNGNGLFARRKLTKSVKGKNFNSGILPETFHGM